VVVRCKRGNIAGEAAEQIRWREQLRLIVAAQGGEIRSDGGDQVLVAVFVVAVVERFLTLLRNNGCAAVIETNQKLVWKPRTPPKERSPLAPEVRPRGSWVTPGVSRARSVKGRLPARVNESGDAVAFGFHAARFGLDGDGFRFAGHAQLKRDLGGRADFHSNGVLELSLHARGRHTDGVVAGGSN
jgi:hypothetical protein